MSGDCRSRILIIEDDRHLREQLSWSLKSDHEVLQAGDRDEGRELFRRRRPDVTLLDLHLPPRRTATDGIDLLIALRRIDQDGAVIIMTGDESKECALRAIESGAYDFFRKPVDVDELRLIVSRALERVRIGRENRELRARLHRENTFEGIIGLSRTMQRVFDAIRRVADSDAAVIIRGESGTGKELVARAVHALSERRDGPFVAVQCSALPETLIESELFGHEKGAYTGADSRTEGRFEAARGGTLFLDEVGTINPVMQSKLLRVLESKQFQRLGGSETQHVDFRLITATNENLEAAMRENRFREDLYYRIHVFPISLPPLRERREDIPVLVDHFLRTLCEARGVPVKTMSREAMESLTRHRWRGNVRELENVIQSLILTTDGSRIAASDLPADLLRVTAEEARWQREMPAEGFDLAKEVERFEGHLVGLALQKSGSVKTEAARLLGIDKNRMMYLCRKHNIRSERTEG